MKRRAGPTSLPFLRFSALHPGTALLLQTMALAGPLRMQRNAEDRVRDQRQWPSVGRWGLGAAVAPRGGNVQGALGVAPGPPQEVFTGPFRGVSEACCARRKLMAAPGDHAVVPLLTFPPPLHAVQRRGSGSSTPQHVACVGSEPVPAVCMGFPGHLPPLTTHCVPSLLRWPRPLTLDHVSKCRGRVQALS